MKVQIVGNTHNLSAGDVVEVDKDTAERMFANGLALSLTDAGKKLEREIREP